MPFLNDPEILREIIMDYYQNPRNKRNMEDSDYLSTHLASDSCIDDIHVFAKFEGNTIKDIAFDGIACAIATSSTSIMSELLIGKDISEAKKIIENYNNMIYEKPYDEDLLLEANAFQNVHKQANRIKCATIGWKGIAKLIEEYESKEK